jgi:hypothetical protein
MSSYATAAELRARIGKTGTGDDDTLTALIAAAERNVNRACHRPDGFLADASASWRKYHGSGGPFQRIDECVSISTVGVKDSPSDVRYVDWTTPDAYSLDAALTVASSGSLSVGTSGIYSVNDVLELDDGTNDVWLTVTADNGDGTYSYSLTDGTSGVTFASGTTVKSTGDWIAFTGGPEAPDFNGLPHTGIMVDPDGSYSHFTSGSFTGRGGFPPTSTVTRGTPTVRVKAKWGYATSVPYDIKEACLMQSARWYKRFQSSMADALASGELGQLIYRLELDPDIARLLRGGRYIKPAIGRR